MPQADLYHITTEAVWQQARAQGVYRMSTRGLGLDEVGFVHCGFATQVARVANTLFQGMGALVVLRLDPGRLRAEVRVENLEGGDELFPHVYGPVPLDAVVEVIPIQPDATGSYSFSAG